jgi:hypothetical protein
VVDFCEYFKLFHERDFAVAIVLGEVDWPFETFYGNLLSVGKVDGVVDTGSHSLADFLDCLEGGVKAELDDEISA